MIENSIEEFKIRSCPLCNKKHTLKLDIFRDILPNDINKDVRVPEFKKIKIGVICPVKKDAFEMDIMLQEDIYSKIKKIRRG